MRNKIEISFWAFFTGIIAVFLLSAVICLVRIKPGEAGVLVNNVTGNQSEMSVGFHWVAPWNNVYRFPTYEQNFIWDKHHIFTFQTCEGLSVQAEMGITFNIQQDKVHILFAKYRRGLDEIADTFVFNFVRDAVNKAVSHMKVEDLYGCGKEQMVKDVEGVVRQELSSYGFNISRVYIIGRIRFPEQVVEAISSKIAAIQRAEQRENELKEAQAQARKEVAAAEGRAQQQIALANAEAQSKLLVAEATAKSNQVVKQSLTSELIQYELSQKWDGKLPQVMGDSQLLLNMGVLKNVQ